MASSVLADIGSQLDVAKQNGFRKDFTLNMADSNGVRKDISYRPTNDQLALIDSHNNEAIKSGRNGYISDAGEDSGTEFDVKGYNRCENDLSSESGSSSEDENDFMKLNYEHYDPDRFEQIDNSVDENDDCNFGKATDKTAVEDILHHCVPIRPNVSDDFGGWDITFTVKNSKPSRNNIRRTTKTNRVSSAFPRPSTETKDIGFTFKHHEDVSDHIKQYREEHGVKQRLPQDTEEGMLVPDPYASKLKNNMCLKPCGMCSGYSRKYCMINSVPRDYFIKFDYMCRYLFQPTPLRIHSGKRRLHELSSSIAENCDFLAVYSSSSKERLEKVRECGKDRASSNNLPRSRPSSLVHFSSHDSSDEDGKRKRDGLKRRPKSLIFFPSSDSRPVVVTSYKRPESAVQSKGNNRNNVKKPRPCSETFLPSIYQKDSDFSPSSRQSSRLQPRPMSDHPFVVRTLSVKDRSKTLNLAPVRNQDNNANEYRSFQPNVSLEHYLNLVVPHRDRQLRRSNSNLSNYNMAEIDEKEETKGQKPALHKKNLQLNITGPCDPWTPKFEFKRSQSRGSMALPNKPTIGSAGYSNRKSSLPDETKQWQCRPEYGFSRAHTYHSNNCQKSETIDSELTVNSSSSRNPPYVQRVYGQRYRCCERIHAMISSDMEESNRKGKDRHIKLPVDHLRCDKASPLSFGSFGIRRGMNREESSIALTSVHKLKREGRQRRFNLSLVK